MLKVKEKTNNFTTSLTFHEDLFLTKKIVNLVKLLKFKIFCFELYFLTEQDLNLLKLLDINKIDYKTIQINKTQNKIFINCTIKELENIIEIINKFHFEEINLWDEKMMTDKPTASNFYLNFNKIENNLTEIIFNNQIYVDLNKKTINNL